MRILHIEKQLFLHGGIASHLYALRDLQRAAGHEVDLFTCSPDAGHPEYPEFRHGSILGNTGGVQFSQL